jgi:hypothetical protein
MFFTDMYDVKNYTYNDFFVEYPNSDLTLYDLIILFGKFVVPQLVTQMLSLQVSTEVQ